MLRLVFLTAAATAFASAASASPLVYQPVNPVFGGYTGNGATLLSQAQAQNAFTSSVSSALASAIAGATQTPAQQFAATIQSRLLSALADQITNAIFGTNPQPSGTYTVEGTTISFSNVNGTIQLTINDGTSTTTITLPAIP